MAQRSSYFVRLEERDAAALDLAEYVSLLDEVGTLRLRGGSARSRLERFRRAAAELDSPTIPS